MFSGDGSSSWMDPMFSGVSLQSLLSLNPSLLTTEGFPNLSFLTDDPQPPNLLVPKTEPSTPQQQQLNFNFFPHHRLPDLRSPENPEAKRHRVESSSVIPQSKLARQRRQKLSEKTRCLQKLMPWDKKMDQGTLLEEAYKYVKFLQAQCRVLHSMPTHTNTNTSMSAGLLQNGPVLGDLEKLNRSQVLQVLVNSPVAQTMLYSRGFCVFSLEQLSLLKKLSQTRQQHLPPPPTTFFI